jgi:hypothetical protein
VEVTKDKKVVWVLWDWKNLGPASGVQILNDPGLPEIPGESEHRQFSYCIVIFKILRLLFMSGQVW